MRAQVTKRLWSVTVVLAAVAPLSCRGRNADFPDIEGWKRTGKVSVYEANTLWEYINGAAELFLDYGVRTCHVTDLTAGEVTVTVDLYDMGTPLNAFGIFNLESSGRGAEFPDAVEAAISPPYQALLLKGARYVKVHAFEGELTDTIGRALLEAVARILPGPATYPAELELLPRAGRIAGSEGYQAGGFLGLTELTNCLYAEYAGEDEDAQPWLGFLMVVSPDSPSPWPGLAAQWESLEHRGHTVLYRAIPYRGLVGVIRAEPGIVGVSGTADRTVMLDRLDGFLRPFF